jgi:hypothetical protein
MASSAAARDQPKVTPSGRLWDHLAISRTPYYPAAMASRAWEQRALANRQYTPDCRLARRPRPPAEPVHGLVVSLLSDRGKVAQPLGIGHRSTLGCRPRRADTRRRPGVGREGDGTELEHLGLADRPLRKPVWVVSGPGRPLAALLPKGPDRIS